MPVMTKAKPRPTTGKSAVKKIVKAITGKTETLRVQEWLAKDKGLMRSEGKEYVVQDGDILLFRFNV